MVATMSRKLYKKKVATALDRFRQKQRFTFVLTKPQKKHFFLKSASVQAVLVPSIPLMEVPTTFDASK
jgi:hypothetical protein